MNKLEGLLHAFGKNVTSKNKECLGGNIFEITVQNPSPHKLYLSIGQNGDIKEPHIHIFRSGNDSLNWLRGISLSLIRNAYIIHPHEKVNKLTDDELKELEHFLRMRTDVTILSQRLDITNWRYLFNSWNEYNEEFEILPHKYRIPSYNPKTITKGTSIL